MRLDLASALYLDEVTKNKSDINLGNRILSSDELKCLPQFYGIVGDNGYYYSFKKGSKIHHYIVAKTLYNKMFIDEKYIRIGNAEIDEAIPSIEACILGSGKYEDSQLINEELAFSIYNILMSYESDLTFEELLLQKVSGIGFNVVAEHESKILNKEIYVKNMKTIEMALGSKLFDKHKFAFYLDEASSIKPKINKKPNKAGLGDSGRVNFYSGD